MSKLFQRHINSRSKRTLLNIIFSLLLKGGSVIISFILVPLTLDYLNPYEYGIWLTLSSIISWINICDIGLGLGLRNKLTEAFANDEKIKAKIYISTSYIGMALIVLVVLAVTLTINMFLNWYEILNVKHDAIKNLTEIVAIILVLFCVKLVIGIIGNIFMARQQASANNLIIFTGDLLALIAIFICKSIIPGSLMIVAIIFSSSTIITGIGISIWLFSRHPELSPNIKFYKQQYFKRLMGLGIRYFVIQIACIALFQSSNLIISNMFGPEDVTRYNIASKIFSVASMGFLIIMSPYWAAVTDAYVKKDFIWIKAQIRRLTFIWCLVCVGIIIIALFSPLLYKLWIGNKITIPLSLTLLCGLYASAATFSSIWTTFINGMGRTKLQLILALISSVLYIPTAIICGKTFGISGIVLALSCWIGLNSTFYAIQCIKLSRQRASGIWNK